MSCYQDNQLHPRHKQAELVWTNRSNKLVTLSEETIESHRDQEAKLSVITMP